MDLEGVGGRVSGEPSPKERGPAFRAEDAPTEVVARIRRAGPVPWPPDPGPDAVRLAIGKLRLAGIYDDRQDGRFMLRTRIPGGALTAEQAGVIAGIARDFAVRPEGEEGPERFVEITTRQDIQIHWIPFQGLPEIWARYEAAGITSLQACGDTLRNVTTCAVAGLDPEEWLDARPTVAALDRFGLDEPELTAALPRKFKVAVTGCRHDCVVARIQDLAFTPARQGGSVGFNVHAGGGLSDYPRLASPLDIFVPPERVVDVVRAALELYRAEMDPTLKAVNRFRMLVHRLGPARIEAEIRRRLPFKPDPAGEDLSTWQLEDHLGVRPQRGGGHYAGLCVPLGRLSAGEMLDVARLAREHGDGGVRLTQRQNLVLTGVRDPDALRREPLLARLRADPDPFERAVVACTSAPFCKFAILDAKAHGAELIEALRARVPESDWERLAGLRIHVSGCKASCAQVQTAQVGLRGSMGKEGEEYHESFDIALGGGSGSLGGWAALEVPAEQARDRIATLVAKTASDGGPDAITLEVSE